jgi:hypothetical protein
MPAKQPKVESVRAEKKWQPTRKVSAFEAFRRAFNYRLSDLIKDVDTNTRARLTQLGLAELCDDQDKLDAFVNASRDEVWKRTEDLRTKRRTDLVGEGRERQKQAYLTALGRVRIKEVQTALAENDVDAALICAFQAGMLLERSEFAPHEPAIADRIELVDRGKAALEKKYGKLEEKKARAIERAKEIKREEPSIKKGVLVKKIASELKCSQRSIFGYLKKSTAT